MTPEEQNLPANSGPSNSLTPPQASPTSRTQVELSAQLNMAVAGFAALPDSPLPAVDLALRKHALSRAYTFRPLDHVSKLEIDYPAAFNAMALIGAHPTRAAVVMNFYLDVPSKDNFRNLGEHCVAEALLVGALGRDLLDQQELRKLVETALTDPLTKVGEALRREAAAMGQYPREKIYSAQAYVEEQELLTKKFGINRELANLIVTKQGVTGHRSCAHFVTVGSDGQPKVIVTDENLSRAILHIADDMLYSTLPAMANAYQETPITAVIEPVERMFVRLFHSTATVGGKEIGYPWMWTKGLGVTEAGVVVDEVNQKTPATEKENVRPIGHYAYFQGEINRQIADQLVARLENRGVQLLYPELTAVERIREYIIEGTRKLEAVGGTR